MQNQYLASSQAASLPDYIGSALPSTSSGLGVIQTSSHLATATVVGAVAQPPSREELKSHFVTREGTYRLMTLAEYSRPNRVPLNQLQAGNAICCAPVRVSFLSVNTAKPDSTTSPTRSAPPPSLMNGCLSDDDPLRDAEHVPDRICFNVGREIYVYLYRGTTAAADLTHPIDKRVYKGTFPTCHDFNGETATMTSCSLLIGFSAGQVQMIDPFQKEYQMSRLYNEERLIDKTPVTCIRWVPGHPQHFLASHSSGCMYLYHEEIPCAAVTPTYQLFKQGDKFSVFTCKTKTSRNPVYKWQIGKGGAIHQFAFSPVDQNIMATVGHDGYLRIFNYHSMELLSFMKSYFGGLLCLSWSPDGALIATGGEDDLLTVYSFSERRVVCRGLGHKSWISQVSFDPHACVLEEGTASGIGAVSEEEGAIRTRRCGTTLSSASTSMSRLSSTSGVATLALAGTSTPNGSMHNTSANGPPAIGVSYRLGSVGHDTQLCLWDVTDDVLKQPLNSQRHRNSTLITPLGDLQISPDGVASSVSPGSVGAMKDSKRKKLQRKGLAAFAAVKLGGNSERRSREAASSSSSGGDAIDGSPIAAEESKLLGTRFCPRMSELPVIEPLICKKIAHERLTVLEFRKDCFVTACQEGFICTWARPGKGGPSMVRRDVPGGGSLSPNDSTITTSNYSASSPVPYPGGILTSTSPSSGAGTSYQHHNNHYQPQQQQQGHVQQQYWMS
ncbi:hypothetical protein PFISCL1PPCAC_2244 [Pristionchus fissidentatus]|uniref:WD40 domain-containing protein n=1 Tax=Pristionchus fissidentatus TaxID=1538716 RepID=A0AAV5UXE1_9BILA|nr:hypothetical protein PFISCL1PPCAC_2244 [Pristionchus fissidentatus]